MKLSFLLRLGLATLVLHLATLGVEAQTPRSFGMGVVPSTVSLAVGQPLTYTLTLTNVTGVSLPEVFVTNAFSGLVGIEAANFTFGQGTAYSGTIITNGNELLFRLAGFGSLGLFAQMTLTVAPSAGGLLTNTVTIGVPSEPALPLPPPTNVVVEVTNKVVSADLAVSLSVPPRNVLAGDAVTYSVIVTNGGPAAVPDVMLTNLLPAHTSFLGVSPSNHVFGMVNGALVCNLGPMASASSDTLHLTIQPSSAGVITLVDSVGAAGLVDPNPMNNTARTNLTVGSAVTGQLTATNASAMTYNPQTGLMTQTVRVSNVGTSAVASARLIVSGLTNWLYNAVGTNNGNPYVVYGSTLDTNQFADLVLEYFVPTRLPILVANSNYTVLGVGPPNISAPSGTNASFAITRAVRLSDGSVLIEFQAVPGARYTVLYSTDAAFSHPVYAVPPLVAPADRVQWIDDGPPKTTNAPTASTSRFYRIIKN